MVWLRGSIEARRDQLLAHHGGDELLKERLISATIWELHPHSKPHADFPLSSTGISCLRLTLSTSVLRQNGFDARD
jgi:hypothetical protein